MAFRVTVYCHDRHEVTFEREFEKWRDAHKCAASMLLINNSVTILDDYKYETKEAETGE